MTAVATEMRDGSAPKGKVRLLTLEDLDRRTGAFKRIAELISALEADLGGSDRLSTAQRQIAQRACLMAALLESMEADWLSGNGIDPTIYSALSNTQRRLLEVLGLERKPRDVPPSLAAYIAQKRTSESQNANTGQSNG